MSHRKFFYLELLLLNSQFWTKLYLQDNRRTRRFLFIFYTKQTDQESLNHIKKIIASIAVNYKEMTIL